MGISSYPEAKIKETIAAEQTFGDVWLQGLLDVDPDKIRSRDGKCTRLSGFLGFCRYFWIQRHKKRNTLCCSSNCIKCYSYTVGRR
ncbi:hypothetical protein KSP40_PGU001369 [Platanthera guangdongensis]|uniref:Uncharacterized protein n=1 Tax=Platanthera guangdongensis TaxID=2320717 RepID=A0ABR2MN04_9ASPA